MIRLSPAQESVIHHRGSDLQVIACAGSGKTESVARRIASLIQDGAAPASIAAFTFTERAAAELKERVIRRVADVMGRDFLDRLGPMYVGTIHGYCFRLLQDYVPKFGSYDVLDEHRHAGLVSREFFGLGLSKLGTGKRAVADFLHSVDVLGNELIDPTQLAGTDFGSCVESYLAMLERYHCLTFGLIIAKAVEALHDPAVFARVHGPLRHLVVDEYQDINPAQGKLIDRLATKPVELTVVGDDDQSIYQWRGSDVRHIIDFSSRRPGATQEPLDTNRRSRPSIIAAANAFAQTIPGRLAKAMHDHRAPGPNEVVPWAAPTDVAEAETIADHILRLHEQGYRYRDIAVLYRSVRTAAPPLLDACRRKGIPVAPGGRTGLFLQPDIAVFGELFAWVIDKDWKAGPYEPFRSSDIDSIVRHLMASFDTGRTEAVVRQYLHDWKKYRLRGDRPVSLVGDFYKHLWFLGAHRIDPDGPEGAVRFGAFARFSQLLADFEHVSRRGRYVEESGKKIFRGGRDRGKPYLESLYRYLIYYARDAYEDFPGEPTSDLDAVDVLTVHQAKGLEWPIVFLPSLVEGRFPSKRTGASQEWLLPDSVFPPVTRARYEGTEAEERRLFYVALTRARDAAYLSCFDRKANKFKPSRFLNELAGSTPLIRQGLPLPGKPAVDTVKETPQLEISYSELAVFDDCGYRYRLATLFGFQQELAVELGYGKAIHHVLRQLAETVRASGKVPSPSELDSLVADEFYLPFADAPAFTRMHAAAKRLVGRYTSEYADDLRRVWAVERPFALHLADGVLSGRADVIIDESNGEIERLAIVDYKVSEDPAREERYRRQLSVYTAAGRGEGLNVDAAYLHELADGTRRSVDVAPGSVSGAVSEVSASLKQIRAGQFAPQPEPTKCGACDYRWCCSKGAPQGL